MRKLHRQCLAWLLALAIPLTLCGCRDEQADNQNQQPPNLPQQEAEQPTESEDNINDAPGLLLYDDSDGYGIINTEGELILPIGYMEKKILLDDENRQIAVMTRQDFEDTTRLDSWDDPLPDGAEYCFYDPQGELICKADLRGMGDVRFEQYPADLQRSLFLCNSIQQDNSIRVVDMNGNILVVKQFDWMADNYGWYITDAACDMMLADGWFMLSWHLYGYDKEDETKQRRTLTDRWEFYTTNGNPRIFDKDYHIIQPIEDDMVAASRVTDAGPQSRYYKAYHYDDNGSTLLDIIDSCGNVLISDLSALYRCYDDVFVCCKDNKRGLMDAEGNWLHIQQ